MVQLPGGNLITVEGDASTHKPGDLITLNAGHARPYWPHPAGEFPNPSSPDRRLHAPALWARLAQRADVLQRVRAFFTGEAFLEVETPLVVVSPGTEVHLAPTRVMQQEAPGERAQPRYLITSPEYHMKRLLAAGAPPIFQICKTFRDGERGAHHRPEFTMLEWYRPWSTLSAILDDCEALLMAISPSHQLTYQGQSIDLTPPWPRTPFLTLLRERGGIQNPEKLPVEEQLHAFVSRVERDLGRERPEFVVDYPIQMASLAQPGADDPSLAERAELYIAGLELANAFGELADPDEQRRRCEDDNVERRSLGLPELPLDEDFLSALSEGLPPSGGIALGVDRLVMLLCDAPAIDDILCF